MSSHRLIAALPAVMAAMGLIGCAREDTTSPVASAEVPPPAPVTPPPAPPPPPAPDPDAEVASSLSEVGAQESDRGYTLRLSSAEFAPGESAFAPTDPMRIDRVVSVLKEHPEMHALVEGHTDSRGSDMANEKLSKERADAVKQALVARGIEESRIDANGIGESRPIADNETAEGREQNRRVEIIFSNTEGRFASAADSPPAG
jgi:outer membrane protein OmpA-like peptidoglycan-associated protein